MTTPLFSPTKIRIMLYLTGFVKDRLFEETPVKPQELIELFNLPLDLNSRKPRVVMKLTDRYVKPDRLNGGVKFPAGWQALTVVNGEFEGNSVTVRYATSKTQKGTGANRETIYQPRYITFTGRANAYLASEKEPKDLEKVVFLMLHPKNADSPIRGKEANDKRIRLDNAVKDAANKVASIKNFVEVYNEILGLDESTLRVKLAGIRKGLNVDSLEKDEVIAEIMDLMQGNPNDFLTKWQAHTTTFDGIINRAIYLALVEEYTLGGNIKAWRFSKKASKDFLNSDIPIAITQCKPNQSSADALKAWILADASNLASIQNMLNALDQQSAVETAMGVQVKDLKAPKITEMTPEQLVNYGLEHDQLAVVKEDGVWQAYFMKAGDITDPIAAIDSYPNRVTELAGKLTTEQIETLKNKVKGSLMQANKKK